MASVIKINGKWRALIRRKGHKSISKWFSTKTKADAWAADIERHIAAGTLEAVVGGVTLDDLIKQYRKLRSTARPILDTSTEHYTLKQLSRTLGAVESQRLTVEDLLGWARQRRDEGAGPFTINGDLSKLGTVLRYTDAAALPVLAEARPKLTYLGLIGGGGKRERRPEGEEAQLVLDWLAAEKGQKYADFAQFSAITAMRRGEVAAILWVDLDPVKKMVLIRDRKDPRKKIGNDQWIPLLGDSWALAQRQPKDSERIFPVHPQTMSKYFTEACRTLGIPDLHLHDLRHEGISKMFEDGFAIQQVALVSGHKSWNMLRRYTNLKPESLHLHGTDQSTPPRPDSRTSASRRPGKSAL